MSEAAHPTRADWLLIGALLAISWLTIFVAHDLGGDEVATSVPRWAEHAIAVAMLVPLAWRRQRPLTVLVVVAAVTLAFFGLRVPDGLGPSAALFIALYSAGAYSTHPSRDRLRGLAVASTLLLAAYQVFSQQEYVGYEAVLFSTHVLAINVAFFITGWLLGDAARRRRADQAELQRRAEQLAAEQRERERRAVLDERVRIARDLHDAVAHHVSVMGVQAGAARRVLGTDTARAAEVLGGIERSGREAVGELQRMVGFLRDADDRRDEPAEDGVAAPQPRLPDVDRLVASAGLPAQVQRVGRPRPLPASVEVSAYRVIQEALTNALKHAGLVTTTVVLTYTVDALRVDVVNARGAEQTAAPGSGRGLVGMRERVLLLGGEFDHGPTRSGGYRVSAVLPTTSEPARKRQVATS